MRVYLATVVLWSSLVTACGDMGPRIGLGGGFGGPIRCLSSLCDDLHGTCDREWRCDDNHKCVEGPIRDCDDGIECTTDKCVETTNGGATCSNEPVDRDGDGHSDATCLWAGYVLGDDCDDDDPYRFPGRAEVCDSMGHDEDCDPTTTGTYYDDDAGRGDWEDDAGTSHQADRDDDDAGVPCPWDAQGPGQ